MRCGEIFYANLSPVVGSETDKRRPVLIVSNDANNRNRGLSQSSQSGLLSAVSIHLKLHSDFVLSVNIVQIHSFQTSGRDSFR